MIVAGGGTAGWMTAAALARMAIPAGYEVVLVESDEIGTVGVGEATLPSLQIFNGLLGIDEADFMQATGATFKLGIEFRNWSGPASRYIHPFGAAGFDYNGIAFHQFWLRQKLLHPSTARDFEDYNLGAVAAKAGRAGRVRPHPIHGSLRYAYHIDAGLYARYLRRYAESRGVRRIEGRIEQVDVDTALGRIRALGLDGARRIDGDFFVDCTGFRSLLLGGALGVGFRDWSTSLLCDSALAVPSEMDPELPPFTAATAEVAGWRWRIPLQHRCGNGYVYSSAFTSDESAAQTLLDGLNARAESCLRPIRFRPGRRETFWKANCVAIGLAAGFLEPLESTSIHLIQTAIARLIGAFPTAATEGNEIAEYNALTAGEYDLARDFIMLHYKLTERNGSDFWRCARAVAVSEDLAHRIGLFATRGRIAKRPDELFTQNSWLAVMIGQGLQPKAYDPLVDAIAEEAIDGLLQSVLDRVAAGVSEMPVHRLGLVNLRAMAAASA